MCSSDLNPELQAIINKHRPQPKDMNRFAPGKNIKHILTLPGATALISDRKKYTDQWIDKFIDALMASEHGEGIAKAWEDSRKRNKIPALIAGPLQAAGVYGCSRPELARAIRKDYDFHVSTDSYSTYMGMTEEQPYLEWVLDYVKTH